MDSTERTVVNVLKNLKLTISTAESCTGGLIAKILTDIPGSSAVLDRGFVTYSNKAKIEMIGVPPDMIETYGAVSWQVAETMAQGALKKASTDLAVSCTGIAGPDGGSDDKPVGTVYIGVASSDGYLNHSHHVFEGDRSAIRMKTANEALESVLRHIKRNYLNEE
jgi:nicotinamide-nucleotide amidase